MRREQNGRRERDAGPRADPEREPVEAPGRERVEENADEMRDLRRPIAQPELEVIEECGEWAETLGRGSAQALARHEELVIPHPAVSGRGQIENEREEGSEERLKARAQDPGPAPRACGAALAPCGRWTAMARGWHILVVLWGRHADRECRSKAARSSGHLRRRHGWPT